MSIYRRVLRYYRPFWGQTILGLFLSLVGIGLNLLKPWPFKIIVDDFLRPTPSVHTDWHTWVPLLCLALVVIQFCWGIINWITNYLFVKIGLQALLKLRTDLYAYLQSLSLKYHDARRSADSSFRVAYDSQSIQTIYNKGFTNIFASVVTLIGTFLVMMRLDWVVDAAFPGNCTVDHRRDLFLRAPYPSRINLDSGTGKRRARAGAGGTKLDPNGARIRARRLRGAAISSASEPEFAGQSPSDTDERE